MSEYAALTRTAAPARTSLGDRVRQLRIARGLTQTDLAGERFSKEYVSQIERGKTRPTAETIEWLAARLGVDSTFLEIGVSSSERERVESVIVRAEASIEQGEYAEALEALDKLEPELATVAAPELELRALLASALGPHVRRRGPQGDRGARPRPHDRRVAVVLGRRPRRGALPPGDLPVQAQLDLDRHRPVHAVARAGRALRAPRRPPPLAHPRVALALLPAPARLGGRARGRRARARARRGPQRPAHDGERVLPGLPRRRAHRPLGRRALARGEGQEHLRGAPRPVERREAPERDRRPQLPARKARGRDRAT